MSRMGLYEQIDACVAGALAEITGRAPAVFDGLGCAITKDPLHGDVSVTAALVMAKRLGLSPRALGADLAAALGQIEGIESASLAGAGFVNLRLEPEFIMRGLRAEALMPAPRRGRLAICLEAPTVLRQRWSAEAAAAVARALGLEAEICAPVAASDAAEARLLPWIGEQAAFGGASAEERAALVGTFSQIWAAAQAHDEITLFAAIGGGYRAGLYEAALGAGALLRCTALAGAKIPALDDAGRELARLYVLCHRAERGLDLGGRAYAQPERANPAFLLHYTASRLSALRSAAPALAWDAATRRLALLAGAYGSVLGLAHDLGAPQRVALYLCELARLVLAAQKAAEDRGEKAICPRVIDACEVVFCSGFAIVGTKALAEIT
ncbi:hypothetical protein [uncultured Lentibacter sp.]|uniref:hypothetical protein n=1 Tax=uncultured Lentibacter sp. TaxID=1659309 RepID=UPI002611FFC6|nr:hypothetical protein [uncultured Lentibacter sp.]